MNRADSIELLDVDLSLEPGCVGYADPKLKTPCPRAARWRVTARCTNDHAISCLMCDGHVNSIRNWLSRKDRVVCCATCAHKPPIRDLKITRL